MFDPHIENSPSVAPSNRNVKRSELSIDSHRRVKRKITEKDFSAARAAGKAASCPDFGDSWYQDLREYGDGIKNRVHAMIQESQEDIRKGNYCSAKNTIIQLSEYRLCQELDSFMLSCPESVELKSGLDKSLKYAVDRGDPGMAAYLIAVGADPFCETGGFNALTLAMACDDGSLDRRKVLSVIETKSEERLEEKD